MMIVHEPGNFFPILHIMLQHLETLLLHIKGSCIYFSCKFYFRIPLAFVLDKFNIAVLRFQGRKREQGKNKQYMNCGLQVYQFGNGLACIYDPLSIKMRTHALLIRMSAKESVFDE